MYFPSVKTKLIRIEHTFGVNLGYFPLVESLIPKKGYSWRENNVRFLQWMVDISIVYRLFAKQLILSLSICLKMIFGRDYFKPTVNYGSTYYYKNLSSHHSFYKIYFCQIVCTIYLILWKEFQS